MHVGNVKKWLEGCELDRGELEHEEWFVCTKISN